LRGLLPSHLIATPRRVPGVVWIALLLAAYGAQLAIAHEIAHAGAWPIPVVAWYSGNDGAVAAMLVCGAIESYALVALYRAGAPRIAIAVAVALLAAASVATPVLLNHDLYAYVGNGLLAHRAYEPPPAPFPGEFAAINAWWGHPVPAATYGPLWLVVAHAVTAPFTTLLAKMIALRLLGLALLGIVVVLLGATGAPLRVLTLVALNPALYLQIVLDAHNDLLPIAIVLAAALIARARPALAGALIAVAALCKLPFALLGLPVLVRVRGRALRLGVCFFVIAASIVLSYLAGGYAYARALATQVNGAGTLNVVHLIAAVIAVAIAAASIYSARRLRAAVWALPAVAPYFAPWYALWSLPYALGARRALVYLLVSFPFVATLVQPSLARWWTVFIVVPLAAVASLRPPAPGGAPGGST
jgi:hypothetical protein